jgi:hypothetical protein
LPAENGKPENIGSTVTEVSERVTLIIREEIELAKVEVTQKVTTLAKGLVAIAAGAVFGVFALVFLLLTAAWGLNSLIGSVWLGFLIVLGALVIATIGAFLFAWRKLKVGAPTPDMAIDEAKKLRAAVAAKTEAGA